ncbi:type II toxin-antitoxin system RatA family toxin [Govanella unica]|uniref:Type II toxin-antitoxin system RatA family toxin n=1 Tax=Govanella unica TaxID=2975056 RepID=A0A9X3TXI6_9PROT|nr:type II toxin-antitoxin system RatA family toxin [Govania unica]MDA5193806.1 type II toxin-antitoxin system RatA family toxin [Govania unica]
MPKHVEKRTLKYSPDELYALVADVARYPEFLPWCVGARILKRTDQEIWADLMIGFKMFRETFTSRVQLNPGVIEVEYVKGPLKHLTNHWAFLPAGDGQCTIDFMVDFEFKNLLFERLVGALFTEAVHRMVLAFEKRAVEVYGPR